MIPLLDLKKEQEILKDELTPAIEKVVKSGCYTLGPETKELEEELSKYLNTKHAITVASGSDALLLSLMAINIQPGDEVITTPFTFFATVSAITRLGAKPIFVDINKKTYTLNPELIKEKITQKTKAIIAVHIFGQACDMDSIMQIAKEHKLKVIEDAAQAIGATYKGKKVGSIGDLGCFSFYPTKNLGCYGDGGLIVTNNKEYEEYLRLARNHGAEKRYYHNFVGLNSRMDELQAAILRVKLKYLDTWNKKRTQIAKIYSEKLNKEYTTPYVSKDATHIYHQFTVLSKKREECMDLLKEKDIACGIYYPVPLHLQECFKYLGYKKGDFPIAEKISNQIFSIPLFPFLEDEKVNEVIETMNSRRD